MPSWSLNAFSLVYHRRSITKTGEVLYGVLCSSRSLQIPSPASVVAAATGRICARPVGSQHRLQERQNLCL